MKTKISDLRAEISDLRAEVQKLRAQSNGTADTGIVEIPGLRYEILRAGQEDARVGDRVMVYLWKEATDFQFGGRWSEATMFSGAYDWSEEYQRDGFSRIAYREYFLAATWKEAFEKARLKVSSTAKQYNMLVEERRKALENA